ncbi:hypothetical protein BDV98DRAFT_105144 [Pterulicium gracile]|uniref:Uncharacterized protein n=1 Tax=Pterulicium gracile TaxID=1884261 RepID=A0A5C3QET2_9AGAR|nr:hypothetical protein BDV98DRAFT_105144 [Pterula gracilis]
MLHLAQAWKQHRRLCGFWSGQTAALASGNFCGLCGLTGAPLRSTQCCDRLVCCGADFLDSQGCFNLHREGTMCAHHYHENHDGETWDSCQQCADDFPQEEVVVWRRCNRFNFQEDISETPFTFERSTCHRCGNTIKICVEPVIDTPSGMECGQCATKGSS